MADDFGVPTGQAGGEVAAHDRAAGEWIVVVQEQIDLIGTADRQVHIAIAVQVGGS